MANDLTITTLESPETLKDIPICEKLVERAELSGGVIEHKNVPPRDGEKYFGLPGGSGSASRRVERRYPSVSDSDH